MEVRTVRPRHITSRGSPTLTAMTLIDDPSAAGRRRCELTDDRSERGWRCSYLASMPFCHVFRRANVLSLSRHVPSRAGQTDTRIHGAQGAEAPDQRTARGRLL